MRRRSKQVAIAALAMAMAMAMAFASAPGAIAQVVTCTNCGSEVTQILNYLQLGQQLLKQAALLEQSLSQTQLMTTNTTPLANIPQGAAATDIKALFALVAQAQSLSFAAANLDSRFQAKFGTYQSYLGSQQTTSSFAAKYQQWSADANASVLTTLKGAGLQATSMQGSEEALLQALHTQNGSVSGQLQAAQLSNAIATEGVRQIQKLRQLLLLDLQLKANSIQNGQDKETSQQAAWQKFVTAPAAATSTGARF
jgi:P-type conjugative transfer protein TrbJ